MRGLRGGECQHSVNGGGVGGRQASRPGARVVVLVEQLTLVAAGNEAHRAVGNIRIVHVDADGERTVIGVRVELDVLMPRHLIGAVVPLEVELRVVKHDIGSDDIGRDVGDDAGREFPERFVPHVGAIEPAQTRRMGRVARGEIEGCTGLRLLAAEIDEFRGEAAKPLEGFVVDEAFDAEKTVVEVERTLGTIEHARWMGEDLFRGHCRLRHEAP